MPKLNATLSKKVKNTSSANPYAPLEEGIYEAKLVKVESGKSQTSGKPMWTWHFTIGEKKIKEWTVLTEDQLWKLSAIFEAFGVEPNVGTDALIGKTILLQIGQEIQEKGKGKGRTFNYIAGYPDQNARPRAYDESDDEDEEVLDESADDEPDF